ncbi:MAG: prepilin-type N-terminal cleavage/methylation domain-containing protein [Chitinivibrionales bacterium]|nr:prepilin-type N-terminal cleavage/methylation domain-containing protein [Chitinivibrionales bacterium]
MLPETCKTSRMRKQPNISKANHNPISTRRPIVPSSRRPPRGYTLLETLIALIIFVSIVVPIISYVYQNKQLAKARHAVTAMCILEQEAERIRFDADNVFHKKSRKITTRTWEVICKTRGSWLIKCSLSARLSGEKFGELVFYTSD